MKIIFFGTTAFAKTNLEHLIKKGYNITTIVSAPDSKKGRGKKVQKTAVKIFAIENKINILQPTNLKDKQFIKQLKSFNADLFVVVAFRMLPEVIWKIPKKGTINLHASLLPEYRGAAPINRVLINGENETGITTFFINNHIDSGEIIMQEKVSLTQNTTAAELHDTLERKGSLLLEKTIESINQNTFTLISQSYNSRMKKAEKITSPSGSDVLCFAGCSRFLHPWRAPAAEEAVRLKAALRVDRG